MIAIFIKNQRDCAMLNCTPTKEFVIIHSTDDLLGRIFTGIIRIGGWYNAGDDVIDAYNQLKIRQPELFRRSF